MSPEGGVYAAVSIPWLKKRIFGHEIPVPNFIGYGIRLFTWSRYDHSFVYIGDVQIVEAQPAGAVHSKLSKYDSDAKQWSADALTDAERSAVVAEAEKLVGTPYGFLDIFCLALATLGLKSKWLLDRVCREDRLICSQLVALAGQRAGVDAWLCGKPHPCLVTPADLANHAKSLIANNH